MHISKEKKYQDNYEDNYQKLSQSLKDFFKKKNTKTSIGFRSYDIPHVSINSPRSLGSKIMQERIEKSMRGVGSEKEENKKLKNILIKIKELESNGKYPNISNLTNQMKTQNIDIKLVNNKAMGEKYNPMNFYHRFSKTTKGRNLYGAVFEH
jgi:hypothetical protein